LIIKIEELTFKTIIGVLDFERVTPQRVVVNLKAKYSYKDRNYINYVELKELIVAIMQEQKFELLEDALEFLIAKITKKFPAIKKLKLEIIKPDILNDCQVSLSKSFVNKKV
jgi:dihydroneopterin aldolase